MNTKILLFSLLLFACIMNVNAKGGIPIVYSSGEDVVKVIDLPQRDDFTIQANDGNWYHANLGILHEQFSLFWIPLFNYGTERYVLYTDTKVGEYDFTYADLSNEDIQYLQSQFGGIPSTPELPFWDAWGGKLVVFFVVAFIFLFAKKGN